MAGLGLVGDTTNGVFALAPGAFLNLSPLLLFQSPNSAPLVRLGILHHAVDLAAFVSLGQVFGYRKTFRIAEEHSVAVLVFLHLLARADPLTGFRLFNLVCVEVAGAERPPDLIDVLR